MFDRLGIGGLIGLLVLFGGVLLIAWENLVIAAGLAFVLAGLGLVVYALVGSVLQQFGMM